jgi:hypothetical protein
MNLASGTNTQGTGGLKANRRDIEGYSNNCNFSVSIVGFTWYSNGTDLNTCRTEKKEACVLKNLHGAIIIRAIFCSRVNCEEERVLEFRRNEAIDISLLSPVPNVPRTFCSLPREGAGSVKGPLHGLQNAD